ncbi:MAG TPA: uracil phosphoribosyltransferase [Egicoccus sp.]|nr:uracil phosphoribosyltransferase [Egicoccus sp.]HSK24165.1 uracil phosphoribosyltransferase [Egicoccus sp.]
MSAVTVLDDPVAGIQLASLRDERTTPEHFRHHAQRLGAMLALRAVADLPGAPSTVQTPLGPSPAVGPGRTVVAVPVLRAGLGLLPGVHDVLPTALVGMIGLERDAATLQARRYYFKVPSLDGAWVLVLEPMLATGGSASDAVTALDAEGAEQVTVLSVVATQQGVDRILDENPRVRIVTAAIDPRLDDNGYINPGLGDFGDRLFGTPH